MRYSAQVRPISYVKAHAAELLTDLAEGGEPFVITQNGEARAVLQDVRAYEQTQETLAMLKLLALGLRDVTAGRTRSAEDVIADLEAEDGGE
jgi:prevent-host-death family protein